MRQLLEATRVEFEDTVAIAEEILNQEVSRTGHEKLEGAEAADSVNRIVEINAQTVDDFLTRKSIEGRNGWYAPLTRENSSDFAEAATILPGFTVLVAGTVIGKQGFFPAIVSERKNGDPQGTMRLHVFTVPYREAGLSEAAKTITSAGGQSETGGMGDCSSRKADGKKVGMEPVHMATATAIVNDPDLREQFKAGVHINHTWEKSTDKAVVTELNNNVVNAPQKTITLSQDDILNNRAMILWHVNMRNTEGRPESATRENALVINQALGLAALKETNGSLLEPLGSLVNN